MIAARAPGATAAEKLLEERHTPGSRDDRCAAHAYAPAGCPDPFPATETRMFHSCIPDPLVAEWLRRPAGAKPWFATLPLPGTTPQAPATAVASRPDVPSLFRMCLTDHRSKP